MSCASKALEQARDRARPGETGRELFATACEVFEAEGHLTHADEGAGRARSRRASSTRSATASAWRPTSSRTCRLLGSAPLVAGDVLALEPGLYRPGLGGVRLEDLVRVGEDGPEVLTDFPYDLEP